MGRELKKEESVRNLSVSECKPLAGLLRERVVLQLFICTATY